MTTISHQQALDKLAARQLVQVIEDDVANLVSEAMSYAKHDKKMTVDGYVLPQLLARWNCVLQGPEDEVSSGYKDKTALAMALLLHKHGIAESALTASAVQAIDNLNAAVALSDAFFRNTDAIKDLLASPPVALKKRPSTRENLTFLRAQDVLALQLGQYFYAAYVHEIRGFNEYPIIELYDGRFDSRPVMADVQGRAAWGETFNDGQTRISMHAVFGMRHVPDPANQFHLIASGITTTPERGSLLPSVGMFTVSDLFQLQTVLKKIGV
ncbi:hypothetical protein [Undibacterium umbellatum]|jgi:hypothetical protein|uniref:Uncharacterized protein n=1 Tax=Undibacterium umbellatum TaxID=2762300 RepID=A0ABR6ZG32_9BURK|nr:hypothetical protein [Undibacterium umbellatum]MBC3910685.1 hypothetical protein [Undibacterium umbellatum]